jgi:hypothetical protein
MTIEQLIRIVTVLAPICTALAAVIAAYASSISARASRTSARVAESQRELAERQYESHQELEDRRAKRELYERRLAEYQAVRVLLDKFFSTGLSEQDANIFSQSIAEADFLFQGDEILDYLKLMSMNARNLVFYREEMKRPHAPRLNTEYDEYVRKEKELRIWFFEQGKTAKEKFKLHLDIST